MLIVITMALAAAAVLVAIVVVAVGGGGELSVEHPDHPPLALPGRRAAGGTDAALLRLPLGLWGYHKQITDEALERFAYELTERDTRIAILEQELAEARQGIAAPPRRPALPPAQPAPATWGDMPVMGAEVLDSRAGTYPAAGDPWKTVVDRPEPEPEAAEETPAPPATRTDAESESASRPESKDEIEAETKPESKPEAEDEAKPKAEDEAKHEVKDGEPE